MKSYFICVRGHVVLYSEKAETAAIAAIQLYGTADKVTTIEIAALPSPEEQRNLYERLRILHESRTGKRLLPVEKLTMLPSISIQLCYCGSGEPSWMEYSPYLHTPLCRVCDQCYPLKEDWLYSRRHR